MFSLSAINHTWTLFLDRDGVLNHEKNNDYIRNWEEFVFYDQTLTALPLLNSLFRKTILVTNQKGVGKGLMLQETLHEIHHKMQHSIESAGGKIDQVFFCSDLADDSPNRKPQPGMALQAKELDPFIDFSKSIMVGNRMSDMKFGRNAGMHTVFLSTTHPETPFPDPHIDLRFSDLYAFAQACIAIKK
jgi:D-glycero-D-manno-heptose 1,7-bisphosphate phosphatase